jgi:hypothetical protein
MTTCTALGSQVRVIVYDETTWGTPPGTPVGSLIPVSGLGGAWFQRNLLENPVLRGNRNPAAPVRGNVMVDGSIMFPLHLKSVGHLLKHAIGVPVTQVDTPGAGQNTHTFKVGFNGASLGSLPEGMTVDVDYQDVSEVLQYYGCKVGTMSINATSEGVVIFEFGIMGKGMTDPIPTDPLDDPPTNIYTESTIDQFSLTIEEGGVTAANITNVSLTLDNVLEQIYAIGTQGELGCLPEGIAMVNGSLTALFASAALLEKALANTESSLKLSWSDGAGTAETLTLEVNELIYSPSSPPVDGPQGVQVSLDFTGYWQDDADNSSLVATLVNDVTSY